MQELQPLLTLPHAAHTGWAQHSVKGSPLLTRVFVLCRVPAPVPPCVLQGDEPAPEDEEEYEADEAEDDSEGSDEGESEDEVRIHAPAHAPPLSCGPAVPGLRVCRRLVVAAGRRGCMSCSAAALVLLPAEGCRLHIMLPGSPAILTCNAVLPACLPAAAVAA